MSSSRIIELSPRIAANTAILNDYLVANHLPMSSFDVDGPQNTLVPKHMVDVPAARVAIIDDTEELRRLVLGPRDHLMSYWGSKLLTTMTSPASVPAGRGPVIHDWVGTSCEELWPAAAQTCNAMARFPGSREPNKTPMYEDFAQDPERARRFKNATRSFTQGTSFELSHIADSFAWGELGDATMVAVGGPQGFVCFAITAKFPSMSFIVQDLEAIVAAAQKEVPHDKAGRVKFMAYDFLTG
ncbi:hypothetical protein DL769_009335 [Monosporascus sp. CRB-8-3]|nr:hypothetical protein DL769_009335 [Monosporascus sp. CRB-8-3]